MTTPTLPVIAAMTQAPVAAMGALGSTAVATLGAMAQTLPLVAPLTQGAVASLTSLSSTSVAVLSSGF